MIKNKLYWNRLTGQNGAQATNAYGTHKTYGAYGTYGTNETNETNGLRGALSFIIYHLSFIILHFSFFILLSCPFSVQAQTRIKIGGNVYGGGNKGEVKGNTTVTVYKGDVDNVFGGARMANVGGNTFVHLDGENATGDIMITSVYGGNDISGVIGSNPDADKRLPAELEDIIPEPTQEQLTAASQTREEWRAAWVETYKTEHADKNLMNDIDASWNAFVRTSRSTKDDGEGNTVENWPIIVGNLFGGGNGDFDYDNPSAGVYNIYERNHKPGDTPIATSSTDFNVPDLGKTYLEIKGGDIAHVYGGGNNATVTENTTIDINNPSSTLNALVKQYVAATAESETPLTPEAIQASLLAKVKLQTFQTSLTSFDYNFARIFGGNNKAEMHIRPTWNLWEGKTRDLYSGGNKGDMTSPDGLLVDIPKTSNIQITNLYGGCRMANVKPTVDGIYQACPALPGYDFPSELSARLSVNGGRITNVYGGNDITGQVYGGNGIGINTTIYGDVYGGGNGAYAYTDNPELASNDAFSDYYYGDLIGGDKNSTEALRDFRPDAEQVSIRLRGEAANNPTIIHGSVFLGGNCASLDTQKPNPLVNLKIGSHVICDNVFLGNNGEKMIDDYILQLYAKKVDNTGAIKEVDAEPGEGESYNSYSSLDLKNDSSVFAAYMEAVTMTLQPTITFDTGYQDYTSYVGSFYCGGNVGSMAIPGKNIYSVDRGLNIYTKFVGGCNKAHVFAGDYNAEFDGGILGVKEERPNFVDGSGNIKDRLELSLNNLTITPLRWNDDLTRLIWNTHKWSDEVYTEMEVGTELAEGDEYYTYTDEVYTKHTAAAAHTVDESDHFFEKGEDFVEVPNSEVDKDTRLLGGNVYGGCYESGHVNGNVVINIDEDVLQKDEVFGDKIREADGRKASGVEFEGQRDDLMAVALTVFGAGYGLDTEIWGSTTVNHNKGYAFQIFGGGELGVVGQSVAKSDKADGHYDEATGLYTTNRKAYKFNPAYSSTVNLNGSKAVYSSTDPDPDLAETEYIYGGGNEGDVCGNTYVNLGNGRIYDAFGGASDADILGHTEVIIGRQPDGAGDYQEGYPWIRDIVYGGNDFGGTIRGGLNDAGKLVGYEDGYDFTKRVQNYEDVKTQLHGYKEGEIPDVLKSSTYVEYLLGRVDTIFGGGYGFYDYNDVGLYGEGCSMPKQKSSYVNIRPIGNSTGKKYDAILDVYGGGTGFPHIRVADKAQDRSYVLIDLPEGYDRLANTQVFGSGCYNGLGMRFAPATTFDENFNLDRSSAIIDLLHGQIGNVYGGGFNQGLTRRTVVNVPEQSTAQIKNIFGGSYGAQVLPPCDVYEANVNYKNTSENATVGAIYGGNNLERRTLFTHINISSPVWSNKAEGWLANVFGAGLGVDTWTEHTEVNLLSGAKVYDVYGGGKMGHVLNAESVQAYMNLYKNEPSPQIGSQDSYWIAHKADLGSADNDTKKAAQTRWAKDWKEAWTFGEYYEPGVSNEETSGTAYTKYATNTNTNLDRIAERPELDDKTAALLHGKKYNTNVIINEGATVVGYAYGAGLGDASVALSGDVYGNTYVGLLGGTAMKDIYAAGKAGGLDDLFASGQFTANTNVFIKGGTCRNVYGGGYLGHVGHHVGELWDSPSGDRLAEAHIVVGTTDGSSYVNGVPAITRNVYGGGEGGSVYGTSYITINNGYVGYRYKNTGTDLAPIYKYVEELDDQKPGDLDLSGNVFGGGYVINSYVDKTNIDMYGGTVRGSLYGGGEIGPIGRGTIRYASTYTTNGLANQDARIYKAGQTHVRMFNGHVMRNVYGGGRGKDSWGGDGTMYMDKALVATLDMKAKGFVFGQTDVNIYGGEIGTEEGLDYGYGNVFGGGDEGYVYSAYEQDIHYTQDECDTYNTANSLTAGMPGFRTTSDVKTPGVLFVGNKPEGSKRYDKGDEGYYYRYDGSNYVDKDGRNIGSSEKFLTEDCHVLVEPWLQVKTPIEYNAHTYNTGDYIPTAYLNTLPKKDKDDPDWPAAWNKVDAGSLVGTEYKERGVIIHNAVFAGGNIAVGSELFANTKTVFGNATATIHDVYNRDLITIGTIHIGGLYGDGNLTFVDGYRELNITNYGTDYYNIKEEIDYSDYLNLPPREQAYYELKYRCIQACTDKEGTHYTVGTSVPRDELVVLFDEIKDNGVAIIDASGEPNDDYWVENGVVSRYAGRYMNTIQRADFCGVFGSRMVMKGAKDRVPEVADNTNYTINRVREVSLNKKASSAGDTGEFATHGNYFGIYSVVNHMGALSSDLDFYDAKRTTDNKDKTKYEADAVIAEGTEAGTYPYGTAKYAQWKEAFHKDPRRNNGLSHNELALASGVYLELTTEEKDGKTVDTKEWGIITGVVQLDLINVAKGVGGGFVYAKNIHGVRQLSGKNNTLLSDLNLTGGVEGARAVTNKIYRYVETDADSPDKTQKEWQTSGNFVHNTLTIIDDCYNISNRYLMSNRVPAHYWYIRGSVYVYDQYITAHTGSANAFSKNEELPITISAAARNQMKLMDVRPNLYAYYSNYNASTKTGTKLGDDKKVLINNEEYNLNTPISYWDWSLLPASERNLFVEETYVTSEKCKIGSTIYPAGMVILPSEYDAYETSALIDLTDDDINNPKSMVLKIVQDEEGKDVVATDSKGDPIYVPFTSVFHSSNEMSHDTGYLLTYKMTNPGIWDTWYTQANSATHNKKQTEESGWENGPTYYLKESTGQLLGQHEYKVADIIPYSVWKSYDDIADEHIPNNGLTESDSGYDPEKKQATFGRAYVVTAECTSGERHYYEGAPVSATVGASLGGSAAPAYVCTGTIQLGATEYVFINDLLTESERTALLARFDVGGTEPNAQIAKDIKELIVPAYYCEEAGLYGGSYYLPGYNYRALETWSSMSKSDRAHFTFNYDALDLLIDPDFGARYNEYDKIWEQQEEGTKYQYDSAEGSLEAARKNLATSFYTAEDPEVIAGTKQVGDPKTPGGYSIETPLDYTATRNGGSLKLKVGQTIKVTRIVDEVEKDIDLTGNASEEITDANSIKDGDILDRVEYEKLLNEQYHYAPIDVTAENKDSKFYIVKSAFYYKEPFAAGQVIDKETYDGLPSSTKPGELNLRVNIDSLEFSEVGTYYYCRDSYTIDAAIGQPVKAVKANGDVAQNTVKNIGDEVPVGFIISQTGEGIGSGYQYGYLSLMNQQTDFTIQGISPMETTTLYVTRDADYDNLSKEKIYTVIYQYDYEESDEDGKHITPISERHVVRIHIMFENGIPTVEDIREPDLVLPGNSITMRIPGVKSNGYEVIGGGWELFENKPDAESHFNGKEYQPSVEPLYWYQDDFYLAYYAKTFNRGKTYSNYVPVHVANYHDLKEVMDDKTKHLHIDYDRTRLKRDAKIYINDYSGSRENGLDLFRDLYDLSVGASLEGHTPLNISTGTGPNIYDGETYTKGVIGGKNLEFFFRTDIDHSKKWVTNPAYDPEDPDETDPEFIQQANSWSPIGTDSQCFEGTVHGDGHTISGLDNSLFYNLCGDVYNLGVKGSFTSAGVVDKGNGYVESCWTSTTGTPSNVNVYAVFGAPHRSDDEIAAHGEVQLVNSYYQEGKTYKTTDAEHGVAKTKTEKAYYDGELAFDLNSFYLSKRYYQGTKQSTGNDYKYWPVNNDGTLPEAVSTGYYPNSGDYSKYCDLGYVEKRFADGDYRYAAGEIPESEDERYYEEKGKDSSGEDIVLSSGFYPIYPDDYIFFGQKLTYGWAPEAHQNVPTAVVRDGGRLSQKSDANRVFRAPAYYRNKTMDVAYFNPTAYLVQKEKLSDEQIAANEKAIEESRPGDVVLPREANPGMTAIDFNGHQEGHATSAYKRDLNDGWFYQPLLDDDGLVSIQNCDQTQNLLVYAPATAGDGYVNAKTHGVLTSYFEEPAYADYYSNDKYRSVNEYSGVINGHLVQSNLTATNDHLLVDKEEFNCPIAYSFDQDDSDNDHLMWYQRRPDDKEYVNYGSNAGWQGVSLPFTAELVTTHQKGEITHFFSGSASSFNGTGTKKGHEYWLREFNSIDVNKSADPETATAIMRYPDATGSERKTVTNTYLWDHYYQNTEVHDQKDKNRDLYQKYYHNTREYNSYPLAGAATPYILGLPGASYYEFDLSGNFTAQNTADDAGLGKLAKQVITFASKPNIGIKVSDDEIAVAKAAFTKNGTGDDKTFNFTFVPTYLKQTLTVDKDYALNADGNAFNKVAGTVTSVPFRPYFTATSEAKGGSVKQMLPAYIVFSGVNNELEEEPETALNGSIDIYSRGLKIYTTSHMMSPTTVRIIGMNGITISTFVLEPGKTIETPVNAPGVYIVNKKKLSVR